MPRTKISEFSATPGNNTDIDGINLAEGCAPSGINDAIRELMAQLKDFQAGTAGDSFNGPIGATTPAAGVFTNLSASGTFALTGDQVQISEGGTGQTTANAAFNALAPSQSTHAGKYLKTDGTNTSWDALDISTADITGTLPIANGGTGLTALGTGVQTALGIAVGSAGAFVVNGGALGTPSSGTVTNLTGTASININGTVGATTPTTGAFTTLSASGNITVSGGTANGVAYLNGSKVLTTGSALTFDGTTLATGGKFGITGNGATPTASALQIGTNGVGSRWLYNVPTGGEHNFTENGTVLSWQNLSSLGWLIGGSEQMRLTSTGLGIGTSSPGSYGKLAIVSTGTSTTVALVSGSAASASNTISTDYWTGNSFGGLEKIATIGAINPNAGANNGGALYFSTSANGTATTPTERMRLDSSGNLGLGVTPSAWSTSGFKALQISSTSVSNNGANDSFFGVNYFFDGTNNRYINTDFAAAYGQLDGTHRWYTAPSGTAGTVATFTQAMTLDASGNLFVNGTTQIAGSKLNVRGEGSYIGVGGSTVQLLIGDNGATDGFLGTFTNHALTIRTNNTERARITSGGDLLINTTSTLSSAHQTIACTAGSGSKIPLALQVGVTTDGYTAVSLQNQAGAQGSIAVNTSSVSYNTSSDYRLKNNQQPLTGSGAFIDALKPKTWNWTADGSRGVGFIAHEVQEVSPGSVVGTKDAVDEEGKPIMQAMEYGSAEFIANIIAELQSLRARVAQLEAK